jgi:AcrR family transcriptional regulator
LTPIAVEAPRSFGRDAPPRKPLYAKLKPGPGLSSEVVFANQRTRLHGAMIELVAERGYEGVTVRSLARLAGVSTRSFYKHFSNAEECFVSTYELLMQITLRRAYAAQAGCADWEEGLRASLRLILDDVARYPKASRLVLIEAFAVGPTMQAPMAEAISGFGRLLSDSLPAISPAPASWRPVAGAIAAGTMRVVRTQLRADPGSAGDPAEELASWILSILRGYAESPELFAMVRPQSYAEELDFDAEEELAPDVLGRAGNERRRILTAAVKLGVRGGFASLTVPKVRAEAGVSRRSFDGRFRDVTECFLEAVEAVVLDAAAHAGRRTIGAGSSEAGIRRLVAVLCTEVARKPHLARLAFVEIFAAGKGGLERRERLVSLGAGQLVDGAPLERPPSELAAEASVAAAWGIAHTAIATGRASELPRLAPLLEFVLLAPAIEAGMGPAACCNQPDTQF